MYTLLILSLKSKKIDLCLLSIEKVLTQHSVQLHQVTGFIQIPTIEYSFIIFVDISVPATCISNMVQPPVTV